MRPGTSELRLGMINGGAIEAPDQQHGGCGGRIRSWQRQRVWAQAPAKRNNCGIQCGWLILVLSQPNCVLPWASCQASYGNQQINVSLPNLQTAQVTGGKDGNEINVGRSVHELDMKWGDSVDYSCLHLTWDHNHNCVPACNSVVIAITLSFDYIKENDKLTRLSLVVV